MDSQSRSSGIGRREFLRNASLVLLASRTSQSLAAPTDEHWSALYDQLFRERLETHPETATHLGLDVGSLAGLRSRLDDYSIEGRQHEVAGAQQSLQALRRLNRKLQATVDYRFVEEMLSSTIARGDFPYASVSGYSTPYAVSILTGPYAWVPDLLDREHPLDTPADAEAYLARLQAFAQTIDQSTGSFAAGVKAGAPLPDFLLRGTLAQLQFLRAPAATDSVFVQSVVRRSSQALVPPRVAQDAATLVQSAIYPALDRQMEALKTSPVATADLGGVWHLPRGDDYYANALQVETTTRLTAEEIHKIGLEEAARLNGDLEREFTKLEMTHGTVLERLDALANDPANYYDNSESGRAALLADVRRQIEATYERLPDFFRSQPHTRVEARRVPAYLEGGYPGGSYAAASLDGRRAAVMSMNLTNMRDRPRYGFPTLTFHESVPGHHLQIGLAQEQTQIPQIRRYAEISAYTEGWAVYAEGLGMEMKIPEPGPYAYIGYLQSMLFRAARLVIDTGLHRMRWSRDRAVEEMVRISGLSKARAGREIDRYCVFPGQACSYTLGCRTWLQLRRAAEQRAGKQFDIRHFHEILRHGPLPLHMLEQVATPERIHG
jgi:uncharacterized protein (DUF885 family)